jgi:hypothetical protein
MSDEEKRRIEFDLFEAFKRLVPELGGLQLVDQPVPPAADVLAAFRGRRVGIEITRRCVEERREREGREETVLRKARELYENERNVPVQVWVNFAPYFAWNRDQFATVTALLAEFVRENAPVEGGTVSLTSEMLPESIQEAFDGISMARIVEETNHVWAIPRAGWFPQLASSAIRAEIADKEGNLNGYRKGCDEVWLLVAAEGGGHPSSWWELSAGARRIVYETEFDRVFLMADAPRQVAQLSTSKRSLDSIH